MKTKENGELATFVLGSDDKNEYTDNDIVPGLKVHAVTYPGEVITIENGHYKVSIMQRAARWQILEMAS
jgi:hypothetical protein